MYFPSFLQNEGQKPHSTGMLALTRNQESACLFHFRVTIQLSQSIWEKLGPFPFSTRVEEQWSRGLCSFQHTQWNMQAHLGSCEMRDEIIAFH